MTSRLQSTLGAIVIAVAVSACGTLPTHDASARLAVTYATMKVIEAGDQPVTRAEKVASIARDAKRFLSGEAVSVGLLEDAVLARISTENLSPADRMLAQALVGAVAAELEGRVGQGLLGADQVLVVNTVLDWVIVATGS